MPRDYAPIAKKIVNDLGGVSNINDVTHCMTRLRFVLKDESKVNAEAIKATDGVMGLVKNGGQYQVIIGNNVAYAYKEVLKLGNFGEESEIAKGNKKEKLTVKKVGSNILDALISTMSPLIPAIIGGSMVKLLVLILAMFHVLDDKSSTYIILNLIGDAPFYFLPVMVATSASKKFKTNTYLAIAIAGVMVHPAFIDLMAKAAEGTSVTLTFLPVTSVKYTYTVIPALCMTWILSYIENFIDRITPAVTKNFLKPMLIILIAAPIAILLIGPVGVWIGTAISAGVYFVQGQLGWAAVAIMGALWPLLVMTGMHRVFTPTIISTIAETGVEGMVMPSEIGANLSLGGVSLAVAYKTKNKELRQTALAAASSAIIAGITEPALYGVAVRLKRPMIASLITGGICGALAGYAGLASRSMASPGLFTSVQFFDAANPSSVVWVVAIMILAVVLSFVLTLVIGFEDIPEEKIDNNQVASVDSNQVTTLSNKFNLTSPLTGKVVPLSQVNDETFANEILGPGIAVAPTEGVIIAPADAIIQQADTGHAVALELDNGIELLIHIGIDTVKLNGEGFKTFFQTGDKVKAGDKLVEFNIDLIRQKNYDDTTMIVITNAGSFQSIVTANAETVKIGDQLLEIC